MINKLKKELKYKMFLISVSLLPLNVYATIPTFNTSDILTEIEGMIYDNMDGAMDDWVATTAAAGADAVSDDLKNCMDMGALFGPLAELGGGEIELPCGSTFGMSNPLDDIAQGLAGDLSGLFQSVVDQLMDDLLSGKLIHDAICELRADWKSDGDSKLETEMIKGGCEALLTYWDDPDSLAILNYLKYFEDNDLTNGKKASSYVTTRSLLSWKGISEDLRVLKPDSFKQLVKNDWKNKTGESDITLAYNAINWQFWLYEQCSSRMISSFMGCVNLNYTDGTGQKTYISVFGAQTPIEVETLTPAGMSCLSHNGLYLQNKLGKLSDVASGIMSLGCGTDNVDGITESYLKLCYAASELYYTTNEGKFSDKNIGYQKALGECYHKSISFLEPSLILLSTEETESIQEAMDSTDISKYNEIKATLSLIDVKLENIIGKKNISDKKGSTSAGTGNNNVKPEEKVSPKAKPKGDDLDSNLQESANMGNKNDGDVVGRGNKSSPNSTRRMNKRKFDTYNQIASRNELNQKINDLTSLQDIQNFDYIKELKGKKGKPNEAFGDIVKNVLIKTRIPIPFAFGVKKENTGQYQSYNTSTQSPAMDLIWTSPLDIVDSFEGENKKFYTNHYLHSSTLEGKTNLPQKCDTNDCTLNSLVTNKNLLAVDDELKGFYETLTKTMVQKNSQWSENSELPDRADSPGVVMKNFNYSGAAEMLYSNTMETISTINDEGSNSYMVKQFVMWKSGFMAQIMTLDVLDKILQNQVKSNLLSNSTSSEVETNLITNDTLIEMLKKLDDVNNNLIKLRK